MMRGEEENEYFISIFRFDGGGGYKIYWRDLFLFFFLKLFIFGKNGVKFRVFSVGF